MDIFLNEKAETERIIARRDLGVKPSHSLFLLAKYYRFVMGYKRSKITSELKDFIKSTGIHYREMDWDKIVEKQVDRSRNKPLVDIEYICVTQSELNCIAGLKNSPLERIAFTALCLAKYHNILNEKNNDWISTSQKTLFRLSGVNNKSRYDKAMMIHKLYVLGMIQPSLITGNSNLKVKIIDDSSPIILKIVDMRELGKEYMLYKGKKYERCKDCGRLFLKRANSQLYCKNCQGYQKLNTKTLTCCDCGKEFVVDGIVKNKKRCDECQHIKQLEYQRVSMAKARGNVK